jgi:hypothetical protein
VGCLLILEIVSFDVHKVLDLGLVQSHLTILAFISRAEEVFRALFVEEAIFSLMHFFDPLSKNQMSVAV